MKLYFCVNLNLVVKPTTPTSQKSKKNDPCLHVSKAYLRRISGEPRGYGDNWREISLRIHRRRHLASTSARLGAELYTLDQDGERANVLVVRGGVDKLLGGKGGADRLLVESLAQAYDTRFLNTRRNLVQNKHGRHNNCYADVAQEPEIEAGKGTVVAFDTTPEMSKMRAALPNMLGPQASNLFAGDQPVH